MISFSLGGSTLIEVFGSKSSRAHRVLWVLEELEIPYDFFKIDFRAGDHMLPQFLQMNPAGKIPVMRDGDLILTESAAIANYLGEKFPEKGLIPKSGSVERANYDRWLFFVMSELEQPLWTMGKHKFALPAERRIPEIKETALWEFERAAELLVRGLENKFYILGDRLSIVDLFIAQTLQWAVMFEVPLGAQILEDYLAGMVARPSFLRIKEKEAKPFSQTPI